MKDVLLLYVLYVEVGEGASPVDVECVGEVWLLLHIGVISIYNEINIWITMITMMITMITMMMNNDMDFDPNKSDVMGIFGMGGGNNYNDKYVKINQLQYHPKQSIIYQITP